MLVLKTTLLSFLLIISSSKLAVGVCGIHILAELLVALFSTFLYTIILFGISLDFNIGLDLRSRLRRIQ